MKNILKPSFVITGFLGSGKTTLLINSIKDAFESKKIAVVVNEFGEVGVDGKVLKNVYSEVIELSQGCVCCTLSKEFESAIRELEEKYDLDILFVETSGSSEPFPIILSLQNLSYVIEGVICIVDAKNFYSYIDLLTPKHQIGSSNIIVLNKVDLASKEEIKKIEKEIIDIKKEFGLKNLFTGEEIFKSFKIYKTSFGKLPKEVFEGVFALENITFLNKDSYDHIKQDSLNSTIEYFDKPISYEKLKSIFDNLPKEIFRAKGIIKLEGMENPVAINYSFGNFEIGREIMDYKGKFFIVLIGKALQSKIKLEKIYGN